MAFALSYAVPHGASCALQSKMRSIKQHAEQLLDNILTHPNMTATQVGGMTEQQKDMLRSRVKAADYVSCLEIDPLDHCTSSIDLCHDGTGIVLHDLQTFAAGQLLQCT